MDRKTDPLYQELLESQSDAILTYIGKKLIEEDAAEVDRLLKEARKNPMPPEVAKRLYSAIREKKRGWKKTQKQRFYRRLVKGCAVLIIFLTISSLFLYNTVDAFKYTFDNFISGFHDDHIDLTPNDGTGIPESWHGFWYPEYIPESYRLVSANEHMEEKTMIFENDGGSQLLLFQQSAHGSTASIDNEGQDKGILRIRDQYDGYWTIDSDGVLCMTWIQSDCLITLLGDLSMEEMLQIAGHLIFQK